jgi:hypothetical protein
MVNVCTGGSVLWPCTCLFSDCDKQYADTRLAAEVGCDVRIDTLWSCLNSQVLEMVFDMILIYVYCCSDLSMFVSCLFVPCLPVILSDWSGWRKTG